jgi:hypothetical protein
MLTKLSLFVIVFILMTSSAFANRQIDDLLTGIGGKTYDPRGRTVNDTGNDILDAGKELTAEQLLKETEEIVRVENSIGRDQEEVMAILFKMEMNEVLELCKSRGSLKISEDTEDMFKFSCNLRTAEMKKEEEADLANAQKVVDANKAIAKAANQSVNGVLRMAANDEPDGYALAVAKVEQIKAQRALKEARAKRNRVKAAINDVNFQTNLTVKVRGGRIRCAGNWSQCKVSMRHGRRRGRP